MNLDKRERINIYTQSDSGLAFILALIVPVFVMVLATVVCSQITGLPYSSSDESVKTFVNTYPFASVIISAIIPQISFFVVFIFVSEKNKVNYKLANQFDFKIDWKVLLLVLLIGVIAMFGFSPLVSMFDYLTSSIGYQSSTSGIEQIVKTLNIPQFMIIVVCVGLLPAICEELIFRGIVTNGLKKYKIAVVVGLSAVLFALLHQNLQQLLYQLFLGGVMTYIVIKTGSIIYTMLLHFFNNFLILLMAYLSSDTAEVVDYSNAWNIIYPILLVIVAVVSIIGILWIINILLKRKKVSVEQKTQDILQSNSDNTAKDVEVKYGIKHIFESPMLIASVVAGVVFWIYAVVSQFVL